jgi:hypothetical protein
MCAPHLCAEFNIEEIDSIAVVVEEKKQHKTKPKAMALPLWL